MSPAQFRHLRDDVLGLTQPQLAKMIGLSTSQIAKIEGGVHQVKGPVAIALTAIILNGPPDTWPDLPTP